MIPASTAYTSHSILNLLLWQVYIRSIYAASSLTFTFIILP